MPLASLRWDVAPASAGAVALVLHGGAVEGRQPNRAWSHNVARLYPIARTLANAAPRPGPGLPPAPAAIPWTIPGTGARALAGATPGNGAQALAVARVRFRWRGWNGDEQSPVADARWALAQARARYPGRPLALVGHSMGGRAALHVADEDGVRLVVGLSPWIETGDPLPSSPDLRTVLIHGDRDTLCPIWQSRETVEKLRAQGQQAALIRVARSDHAMLIRARLWSRLVANVVVAGLADVLGGMPPPWPGPERSVAERAVRAEGPVLDI